MSEYKGPFMTVIHQKKGIDWPVLYDGYDCVVADINCEPSTAEWIASRLNRADKLDAEVEILRGFVESLLHRSWGHVDVDGGDIQDEAEKRGLIVKVPPDEEFKQEYGDDCEYMYVVAWSSLADKEQQRKSKSDFWANIRHLNEHIDNHWPQWKRNVLGPPLADKEAEK